MKAHNQLENFKYLVESYDGKLTIADRDLIAIILGEPSEVVYLSSSELAAKANVHASTVVRLARKLGFKGYPDMRNSVRYIVDQNSSFSNINQQRRTSISQGSNLTSLVEGEIAALAAVVSSISQRQIDEGAQLLANADVIYLCEHDVFYHSSHFAFVPERKDKIYYNQYAFYWKTTKDNIVLCNDCVRSDIWRNDLYDKYKSTRTQKNNFNKKIFTIFAEYIKKLNIKNIG